MNTLAEKAAAAIKKSYYGDPFPHINRFERIERLGMRWVDENPAKQGSRDTVEIDFDIPADNRFEAAQYLNRQITALLKGVGSSDTYKDRAHKVEMSADKTLAIVTITLEDDEVKALQARVNDRATVLARQAIYPKIPTQIVGYDSGPNAIPG